MSLVVDEIAEDDLRIRNCLQQLGATLYTDRQAGQTAGGMADATEYFICIF